MKWYKFSEKMPPVDEDGRNKTIIIHTPGKHYNRDGGGYLVGYCDGESIWWDNHCLDIRDSFLWCPLPDMEEQTDENK